uniref:Uncharacterized protein n=1 Tax=Eutreptiella gymnastica TaxID=73025 RepID=A0A7S4D2Z5_9EUGL
MSRPCCFTCCISSPSEQWRSGANCCVSKSLWHYVPELGITCQKYAQGLGPSPAMPHTTDRNFKGGGADAKNELDPQMQVHVLPAHRAEGLGKIIFSGNGPLGQIFLIASIPPPSSPPCSINTLTLTVRQFFLHPARAVHFDMKIQWPSKNAPCSSCPYSEHRASGILSTMDDFVRLWRCRCLPDMCRHTTPLHQPNVRWSDLCTDIQSQNSYFFDPF